MLSHILLEGLGTGNPIPFSYKQLEAHIQSSLYPAIYILLLWVLICLQPFFVIICEHKTTLVNSSEKNIEKESGLGDSGTALASKVGFTRTVLSH